MRWLWIGFAGLAPMACGGSDDHPQTVPPIMTGGNGAIAYGGSSNGGGAGSSSGGNGGATTGGKGTAGGGLAEAGEGGESSLAPVVEILSPAEVLDPNAGSVLIGKETDEVTVTCRATRAAAPDATDVDPSRVGIAMLNENDEVLDQPSVTPISATDFRAKVIMPTDPISRIDHGVVKFRCTAWDKSHPKSNSASATVSTFIDRGPIISVVEPLPGDARRLLNATHFEFSVKPSLLAVTDPGAAVSAVTLSTAGVAIQALATDPKRPGTYVADVDFNDRKLFPVTPSGSIPVQITASNKRKPTVATRAESYNFSLDGAGPLITITSPASNSMVGGPRKVTLKFSVQDDFSGIDVDTVSVSLNDKSYRYDPTDPSWALTKPAKPTEPYTFSFDLDETKFTGSLVQVTTNVDASDRAGNAGQTASMFLRIDQWSPIVTLDVQEARIVATTGTTGKFTCSAPFDPLGDAANDGGMVERSARFRAFIWERTNEIPSSDVRFYAGVDTKTPHLYLQNDVSKPLLIDTNGDGVCDDIDPEVMQKRSLDLLPVIPQGIGNTNPNSSNPADAPSVTNIDCVPQNVELKGLCAGNGSRMTFVAGQRMFVGDSYTKVPAVWATGVTPGEPSLLCTGDTWELSSDFVQEGWICLAAVATDNVGNRGVSPPLRVCFDDDTTPDFHPPCALMSTTPPSCTKACRSLPVNVENFGDGKPFLIGY